MIFSNKAFNSNTVTLIPETTVAFQNSVIIYEHVTFVPTQKVGLNNSKYTRHLGSNTRLYVHVSYTHVLSYQ